MKFIQNKRLLLLWHYMVFIENQMYYRIFARNISFGSVYVYVSFIFIPSHEIPKIVYSKYVEKTDHLANL